MKLNLLRLLPLTIALALGCSDPSSTESASARPNVVFVVVDTLRADHTSLGGYLRDTTPQLAERFAKGTVFERAYSASSWTLPSMAMMFTGAYRLANDGDLGAADAPLTEAFQGAGYRTGAVVANPLLGIYEKKNPRDNSVLKVDPGFGRGFDFYDAHPVVKGRQRHHWYADELVRRGTDWVDSEPDSESGAEQPFFLWLHMFDPHFPREPALKGSLPPLDSDERADAYRASLAPEERQLLDQQAYAYIEAETAKYDEEVAGVDAAMGDLFDWLEATGRADNTLIVFTSDHGEGLWNRAHLPGEATKKSNHFPALYDDHGVQVYSEQVHVPLAFWGPGIEAGRRIGSSVSIIDLAPTLHELCDLPFEAKHAGQSLVTVGRFDAEGRESGGISEVFSVCSRSMSLTLDGRWRLHMPAQYRIDDQGALPELYDLSADPGERSHIEDPTRIAAMGKRLGAFRLSLEAGDTAARGRTEAEEAARREMLDAMGYIEQ